MDSNIADPYPGSNASTSQMLDLANEYYEAAMTLSTKSEKESRLASAPARLCCIHAIELYLNAFLKHEGIPHKDIRGLMHKLADSPLIVKLKLKKKTSEHLNAITEKREYLISRYGPEMAAEQTEMSRLSSTLTEIMTKVRNHIYTK
jgi:hypothetical protein